MSVNGPTEDSDPRPSVEFLYELSPMQQAMLFHSLYAPRSGVYVVQLALRLSGRLDLVAFERAFRYLLARHGILRTAFHWEELEKPLQVVYREVDLAIARESWRELDATGQRGRLAAHLDADRERGFDLTAAPLLRLALFELGPGVHQLVWSQHHLLVDGWSRGQLLAELFTAYRLFAAGSEPWEERPRGFGDYIAWLQQQDLEAAEAFWRQNLAGFTTPTFVAGGGGAPSHRDARRLERSLPAATTAALREVARRHRLTLNTLVQGAWALLLARASGIGGRGGTADVVFGTTVSGRPADLPGVESIVGPFINTQPMRVEMAPEQRLAPWLAGLQERQVEMRRFEYAPLVEVQRWSELASGVALFDHLLVFENLPPSSELAKLVPELAISEVTANELTNYPLNVVVAPGPELSLTMLYDGGRFEAVTVLRTLAHLAGLLATFASDPDLALSELPVLLPGERQQLQVEWNDTASTYPREASVPALFAAQVAAEPAMPAMPAIPAVVGEDGEEWSYGRLEAASNRLARHLGQLGVAPGSAVGISMERSPELIVGMLAILKAGGAYVPLDAGYPDERLAFMLADTGASTVLVHGRTRGRLAGLAREVSIEDREWQEEAAEPLALRVPAAALAYVIYTSGSTGRPKGVAVPHRAIARLVKGTNFVQLGPDDRVAHVSNISFDAATFEIWGALLNGGTLVVLPREVVLSPAEFARRLAMERVTAMFLTAALFNQMVRDVPAAFQPLRHLLVGGAALDPAAVSRALAAGAPLRLLNGYGPTESTTFAVWSAVREVAPGALSVPIGRPLANTTAYVIGPWGDLVPLGQVGELHLGGDGLAHGYLGRPELTAEKFVPHPWSERAGKRLYRTGDLARQLADGVVDCLGRIDHQVKIRGFRIEPGEVEAALAGCPGVEACAVLARRDRTVPQIPQEDVRLVAYVVPAAGVPLHESGLRDELQRSLPDYMLPAAFVFLTSLPLTPNGKVDRLALPAPEDHGSADGYVAPRDPVEGMLAGIWEEVLGREQIGATDDFFALGGHSLLATQVVSRVRTLFEVELPLRQLFEAPTLAGLARAISGAREAREARDASQVEAIAPPIVPVPRDGELPLSFAQQRLWFIDQLEPGNPAYNVPWAMRLEGLEGEIEVDRLRRTFGEVVRRHEALRTTFEVSSGRARGPVQRVRESLPVPLPLVSLERLPAAEREAEIRRLALREARRSFGLSRGPLLRLTLLRVSRREHVLLVTMHHIVSDGWSMGVLLREVMALYGAFSRGAVSPLPELPVQYADFAAWQRSWLAGAVLERQLAYWRRQLAGAPPRLELATDRPRPAAASRSDHGARRAGLLETRLEPSLAEELAAFSRSMGVTLFMTLLSALGVLLGRSAHQEEVLVGTPIANRTRRETEGLIGFFVNTLVLRVPLGPAGSPPSSRDLLGRVRQAALDAYTHQDLPFERLVEEVVLERNLGHSPLFQVMFALQNAPVERLDVPGLSLRPLSPTGLGGGVAKFDLTLTWEETAAGLSGLLEYDAELFDRTSVARLLARCAPLLRGMMADPEGSVAELPLLLPGERAQLLHEWNDSRSDYPRRSSLQALFAARAEATPEKVAVVEAGEEWSYRRLAQAAHRLAWHLRALGVESESRVGVAMERSAELIVAFLGILGAGGVYVPLDPGYPDERLSFMLEDTETFVVLVHGRTRERLAGLSACVSLVCLDRDREAIAARSPVPPPDRTTAEQLAYVLYTSGSTGRPKGVAVPHRTIVRLVRGTNFVQLGPDDRVAHVSNISFDAATFEIWGALLNGGTLVVIDRQVILSPAEFARRLAAERVTAMFLTAALFNQVVQEEPAAFYPLRHLLVGGAALDPAAVSRALAAGAPERLLNGYGPTESTTFAVWSTVREVAPGALSVPIGRPLANTTAYVVGPGGDLAPLGQVGELHLGGEGLARGYLGRPELTAEKFVPHPWSGRAGERLYQTGDLARQLADGVVDCLGRIDHQVKIRGFRIEPGEVEAALAGCPAVEACAVLAQRDRPGAPGTPAETRLVAYVVARPGERPNEGDLREYLAASLPEYMLPAVYRFLSALPLTPNSKVDRAALSAAPESAARRTEGYLAPRGPIEGLLAGIWEEVLGREGVGVADDFFALGGHSLLATQVASRVRQAFGVELTLRDLFARPTIASLAAELDQLLRREERADLPAVPPLVPLAPERREPPLPLSFAQQRLWFIDQLAPGDVAYNMPWAVRTTGELDTSLLRRVFAEVVRRHEALRTTFVDAGQGAAQRIEPPGPVPLPVISLEGLPEEARQDAAVGLATALALRHFDLSSGPLLRLTLFRLSNREHVLLVVMHHIVSDGWSMGVLLQEIGALYGAYSRGAGSPLPELPVQYADFAVWQRSWLAGEVLEAQLAYWREQLAGAPTLLELPTDRPRPAVQSRRGRRQPVALEEGLAPRLAAFSRQAGVTPFMTLLAVFGALLGRWANQPEVLVGSPIANRTHRDTEGLIGFFVNTLVLRVSLGAATSRPSFRDLLSEVRQRALDAYTHQDLPFERLVEAVGGERSLAHSPLFQVMFGLQNAPVEGLELPGLALRLLPLEDGLARFDLSLMLFETAAGLAGGLEYDSELFDPTTAGRLVGRFARLLHGALAAPDREIWDLPFLFPAERAQLLQEWNDSSSEYPRESSLPALFAAWVEATPEATAVVGEGGEEWSYGRLSAAANRLAWHLLALGVGTESRVGVAMERSPALVVALLGILKAGGVYLPLDPSYPDERLTFMLEETASRAVLVHGRTRERLAGLAASDTPRSWRLVCLESDGEEIAGRSAAPPPCRTLSAELAQVIYTSGSTGRPKGVGIPHQAIVRTVRGTGFVRLGPGDRVASMSNISFDGATLEVWGTLLNGGALVIVSQELVLAPLALMRYLRAQRVTAVVLASALLNQVVREEPTAFAALRHLTTGGEALDPVSISRALRDGAPGRLINAYGPAESTVAASWHDIRELAPGAWTVPIGRPLANTTIHLLDPRGELAALGQVGEVYIGGDGLARGYWNRPELTAERFLPDPWSAGPGGRLYRTGDLARHRGDGVMEFMGRVDHQVKIRGFRIEPREIEVVLAGCPGVRECAVLVHPASGNPAGSARLVAYLVAEMGTVLREEEVRDFLRLSLPEYMVPSAYRFLDALPLTPNGKLDRAGLPAPEERGGDEGYVAPRSPVEELLAEIWAEVLGRERVGVEDDFFALGGHSLLATRVVSRVRQVCAVELSVRRLFEGPTVAELARWVAEAQQGEAGGVMPPILPVPRQGEPPELPLSFAQQRLWFIDQLEPGTPAYNVPWAVELRGELAIEPLRRTFGEVVRRHEVLRTTFGIGEGGERGDRGDHGARGPVQVIAPSLPVELPVVSLDGLSEPARRSEVRRLAAAEARHRFDLRTGPLLRLLLLRLADREHRLLLTVHHIVADGWSLDVLLREVTVLYGAFLAGRPSPLPEPAIQYADFAVWQRAWLTGEVLAAQLAYWREQLAGAPLRLELPTDRPRPVLPSYRGGALPVELTAELSRDLAAFSRHEGATLFMTLIAAYGTLLGRSAGQADVLIGTPIANRNHQDTEGLIGFFVNTLVLRVNLLGGLSFRQLLDRVRQAALGAYTHQDLPFERLVEELDPERDPRQSPLFQVMFALQNAPAETPGLPGFAFRVVEAPAETTKSDLMLGLTAGRERIVGGIAYRLDLFDATTLGRAAAHFQVLLQAIVRDADRPLGELPLLAPGEHQQVVREWNDTGAAYPDRPLHALFDRSAAAWPEAVAVVAQGVAVSYGELRRRANRLAHHLRALGVGPEARVGLLLGRSAELIVGVLGILKAGGAYVPMDPDYPEERLAYILADSGARLLLTRSDAGRTLSGASVPAVDLDRDREAIAQRSPADPESGATAANLAYVIYTSGSTGAPKGVLVQHASAVNYVVDGVRFYGTTPADRGLQFTSINFDASVEEIFTRLFAGATLVLRGAAMLDSPRQFMAAVAAEALTSLTLPTAYWHELAAALDDPAVRLPDTVRLIDIGGEKARAEYVARWQARGFDGAELVNVYGPTEVTIACARLRVARPAGRVIPIGHPISNTRIHLLGPDLLPVPMGTVGGLFVAGDGVARGYHGQPGLTAASFVPDPWSDRPGARMYGTGDLAVHLRDGTLEFRGRSDDQVKIRGFRIEPGEIEAALALHPTVREVLVLARTEEGAGASGALYLAAYVVLESGATTTVRELQDFLRESLPRHMVPAAFVVLEAMPLGPNGKVDRGRLPTPVRERSPAGEVFLAPRDPLELSVARVFEELLGLSPVGARDNFFTAGGHSLLAVRLVARIEEICGRRIPLSQLLQNPTVEGLASLIRLGGALAETTLVPLQAGGGGRPLFLVHPVGGSVLCYVDLARHLGPDRPVYGLQRRTEDLGVPGGGGREGIEQLAARYLAEIRVVQTHGPYLLGGWSLGGVVAYEMARQLRLAGEPVDLLALVDSALALDGVAAAESRMRRLATFAIDLGIPAGELRRFSGGVPADLDEDRLWSQLFALARDLGLIAPDLGLDWLRARFDLFDASYQALCEYRPEPYAGEIALFIAAERYASGDAAQEWQDLASAVDVRVLAGGHYDVVREPNVQILARELQDRIDRHP